MHAPNPAHPRPWHSGSIYGDGPRLPRDREQRARWKYLIRAHLQAHRLTHAAAAVAGALLRRLGADGQCDPSHDTLAADTAYSARTVARALASLLELGLVRWVNRLVRVGWRSEQSSNAYCLLLGGIPSGGQRVNASRRFKNLSLAGEDQAARENAVRQLRLLLAAPQACIEPPAGPVGALVPTPAGARS